VFTEATFLFDGMLNPNNNRIRRAKAGSAELAKPVGRSRRFSFKRKRRSVIDRSARAYKFGKLIRLYLRFGLGLGESLLQAEADLKEFAWG
jgi:hypothetical protein